MAEFKIGRLRFTWRGQWATAVFYNRDAVVQFNGKTFVCLVPHTSGDFYQDIEHVTQEGAQTPYWDLMMDGTEWKGTWTPDTYYSVGNIVLYGGTAYICTTHHTSGQVITDADWAIYSKSDNWNGNWAINTAYGVGETIKYGGIVYRCVTNHVSASTVTLGLEADQSKWEMVLSGIDFKGTWANGTRYKLNDLVKNGPDIWRATSGHTATLPFTEATWAMWLPGQEGADTWDPAVTYQTGDDVVYGGYSYISLTSNNINTDPLVNPSTDLVNWQLQTTGYSMMDDWSTGTPYKIGNVVRRGGYLFVANKDSTNSDPTLYNIAVTYTAAGSSGTTLVVSDTTDIVPGMLITGTGFSQQQYVISITDSVTLKISAGPNDVVNDSSALNFVGINKPFWDLILPSIKFNNRWVNGTFYATGEVVVWQNATYICIASHNASSVTRPDLDVGNTIWQVYLYHARKNAMNTIGDLETYDSGVYKAVPILSNKDTLGNYISTQDYTLRSTNGLPQWQYLHVVPKVFYVTPDGQDRIDYGTTWDHPWKTIKYACGIVANGLLNQNAKALLENNKDWLLAESLQFMLYQIANNIVPYTGNPTIDQDKLVRDASYIIDAVIYDISRGGNSQTVAATLAYFALEGGNKFVTPGVTAQMPYFLPVLNVLSGLMINAINQTNPSTSYQALNNVVAPVTRYTNPGAVTETGADTEAASLTNIVISALTAQNTAIIPKSNQGLTATIMIKTGTYYESLPITVPENVGLNGDELRGVVVSPKNAVNTICKAASGNTNTFTLLSTEGLSIDDPVQFVATALGTFGGITVGQTYYVTDIIGNQISVTDQIGNDPLLLADGQGSMTVFGADALRDMFRVRNGSGIRNMTLSGLLGTLSAPNTFETRRPTGASFVSLDPGTGPDDTSAWIIRKSPYVQNVTTFGQGCVGLKIDGTLHNGGNKSVVANDFTQIVSDGIGVWCTGSGSLTELVSVFCYYNYSGYFAEDGGRIRATNGNSSYGTYGAIAEGFDANEVPISGKVFNRSTQVQASVQSSFGSNAQLLKLQFANAGSGYTQSTTNMLKYSNTFDNNNWVTDSNVTIQKNTTALTGLPEAWTLTGATSNTNSDYIYQNVAVVPAGATYSNLSGINVTGSGSAATFNVTVTGSSYVVTVNNGGTNYVTGNQILISGSQLGGADNLNDCIITVQSLAGSAILTTTSTGTVPTGSDFNYTFSVYTKQDTAASIDIQGIFSGTSTVTSGVTFTFASGVVTPSSSGGGFLPTSYGKVTYPNGWYRVYFTLSDTNGLNNQLQFRVYPRGITGAAATGSKFYGAQMQVGNTTTFYLETTTNQFTAFTNYNITGAGTGAVLIGDEQRSNAVFQTRVTDTGSGAGGTGYLTASNSSQGGTASNIILAGSDINTESQYTGMRLFINAGTGAGQYGYITAFDFTSKTASIAKESFDNLTILSAESALDTFGIAPSQNATALYVDMPVQFIPTYYTTAVTATSIDKIAINATVGGTVNTIVVDSTAKLRQFMTVTITGDTFGNLTTGYEYFISDIINDNEFQVSTLQFGPVWALTSGTPVQGHTMYLNFPTNTGYLTGSTTNMISNMPIQFTGKSLGGLTIGSIYYVGTIIDDNTFTIASSLITVTGTATSATNNSITVASTSGLIPFTPIIFTGTTLGGIVAGTTYFIGKLLNATTFNIATSIITTNATHTELTSNLITVSDTTGFVIGNPIVFVGTSFGNIIAENIYYILAINSSTSFTISQTPGGSAVILAEAFGDTIVKTVPAAFTLTTDTGSMTGTTTTAKTLLTQAYGAMTGTYSTQLFGGISRGTTYYINTVDVPSKRFTVTATRASGVPVALTDKTGSMSLAAVGWDHITIGNPIAPTLDSSSLYYVEPRTTYTRPPFTQVVTTGVLLAPGSSWTSIGYGDGYWMAMPTANATGAISSDGVNWTAITLPSSQSWTSVAYGNGYWVAISSGGTGNSKAARTVSRGEGWRTSNLPSVDTWIKVVYGNGRFVALSNSGNTAYSTNYGSTWTNVPLPAANDWTDIAYGSNIFVAIQGGGFGSANAAYSTNGGLTWTTSTLPNNTTWSSIAYGNGRFVAVSSSSSTSAYSFDGITWYSSNLAIAADRIAYGQGVFVAVTLTTTTAYTSEGGFNWITRTVTNDNYGAIAFGFTKVDSIGKFVTLSGQSLGSVISAGAQTKGRAVITSGVITSISEWETGSNYTTAPTVTFTDPNTTTLATVSPRIGNGAIGNPTFLNKGTGYSTTSTTVAITGSGYADSYQTGLTIIVKDLSALPGPGDNLVIAGNPNIYKVTNATVMFGTTSPNIEANIQVAPDITVALSPENEAVVTIRTKYSQVRLTGHDFLNIGYGNQQQSNYPGLPTDTVLSPQNHTAEVNYGRVFYTSTDQDGDFRVGGLFAVQQATGIVTLSASQFGLTGLETLSLGGIAVGGAGVVISQFSTDSSFVANSNNVVPTQRAIKSYLTSRLSQGGSNTFTGQLIAGTVLIGGPDKIASTIPEGTLGSNVRIPVKVSVQGQNGAWGGDGAAMAMFMQTWNHR
jgi:hypothetical protein